MISRRQEERTCARVRGQLTVQMLPFPVSQRPKMIRFVMGLGLLVAAGEAARSRSLMYWVVDGYEQPHDTPAVWAKRIANVKAHLDNVTGVSPCIFSITAAGGFGVSSNYKYVDPYVPQYAGLGLDIVPLIDAAGGIGGLRNLLKNQAPFINAAVALAVKQNYSGYNFDNELRGSSTDASWAYLKDYAEPWVAFLSKFADALHGKGKTLSVDLAGCCGWVDTAHPLGPAGHCAGAFSTHEFVATTCAMYKASRVDIVYGMSTYSGKLNGPGYPDPKDNKTYDGPEIIETIANATQTAIGADKYALGFKGGWPYCSNGTEPDTCIFDGTARATIDHVRDVLGVKHASQWVNEPRSQAAWDAYGYFLHGP